MTEREKLIKLLDDGCRKAYDDITGKRVNEFVADYLLANGVIVTPCVAMVEQFIKDGKFDNKRTSHNGKYADEECVVQYHPPKSEYVNFHPYCLHLWRKVGENFETPPKHFVG